MNDLVEKRISLDRETRDLDRAILDFIRRPGPERRFGALALRLFEYQFRRNANYGRFCAAEGRTPDSVKRWEEIPAMPTVGFKELVLATFPVRDAARVFKTSGTSRGGRGVHFFDTLDLYEAAIPALFEKYLLPDRARCAYYFLMPPLAEVPHSSLSYMMGVVNRRFAGGAGRFYVRKDEMKFEALFKDLAAEKKKVMLCATAFALKAFLDFLGQKKARLGLPAGSRLMETGGFKGRVKAVSKETLYRTCRERLGIEKNFCVSEYGMTELSSQFYDTTFFDRVRRKKRKPFKIGPPWTRTLVIDPRTGREARSRATGLLRHWDLANRGSVMTVQTEDRGRRVGEGFELLGRDPSAELRGCSLAYEEFIAA